MSGDDGALPAGRQIRWSIHTSPSARLADGAAPEYCDAVGEQNDLLPNSDQAIGPRAHSQAPLRYTICGPRRYRSARTIPRMHRTSTLGVFSTTGSMVFRKLVISGRRDGVRLINFLFHPLNSFEEGGLEIR